MATRLPHGRAKIISPDGRDVVSADAIALLSGVNFGSVEKVIAAVLAIQEFSGTELNQLVNLTDVPLQCVSIGNPHHANRASATRAFCEALAASGRYADLEELLHLQGRFLGNAAD